jgi:hypothetical protein
MVLGEGSVLATRCSLHSHCNAMIEGHHDSEAELVDFADLGFSLIVQGGHRDNAAAAVSFVIQPDGIFVDVIAVSHSHHSGSCKLTKDYFQPATQSQRALLRSVEGGSFRGQCLETFLIAALSRFAVLKCTERVAMCLKCTKGQRLFCARHGFKGVRKEHIPSPNLFAVVPKSNAAAQPPDAFSAQPPDAFFDLHGQDDTQSNRAQLVRSYFCACSFEGSTAFTSRSCCSFEGPTAFTSRSCCSFEGPTAFTSRNH